ncbi:hypothetical protein [Francisella adeliensis]|uniref:Uncharacterized protein n=1 Tax=Francisella adeliensis TaxID=2007306 RepID=A0A2Z4XXX1_9GAMM|nr:hypothetical protein [Francisella adeliensis]AXA33312.1 hypothetical protein CDH04_02280 [Francisella adeliensis]MBK2085323.1 hypothetical protein [Francisella adeliensis]MBK2097051.1 hypothetical protein [Francisella adeliensis]QIW11542.1 hypothetical protein FZC43_02285 [Francisella adeliensis]QIW13416.1 hypothetical protein FZC44_02285 [Francisella adeliensis]
MSEDYNFSNKLVVFILSTFNMFSFNEYKYEYEYGSLREYITKNNIPNELVNEFLECLFSISLNEAYLTYQDVQSSNSYLTPYQHAKLIKFFYDDFKEEIEKAKLFIIWYVNNSDRFKISKLCNYKSIVFEPTAFEQSFLANATVGLKRDNVTTVAKLYKTFLQTQNCKYYETFWLKSTEPNLSRMFEDYKEVFDTSYFKSHIRGNKYVIKLPDVDKFICNNLTVNDIFGVLFNLWQVYCSIKKTFMPGLKIMT